MYTYLLTTQIQQLLTSLPYLINLLLLLTASLLK